MDLKSRIRIVVEIGDEQTDKWFIKESHELYRIGAFKMAKFYFDKIINLLTVQDTTVEEEPEEIYAQPETHSHVSAPEIETHEG